MTILLTACHFGPPAGYPRGSLDQLFPSQPRPQSLFYVAQGHRLHYIRMPGPDTLRILFIHGTPGDWKAWAHFLADRQLQQRATLIAVDRAGFGESEPGQVVPGLEQQARMLEPLLRDGDDMSGKPVPTILVGHSLGGPIAAKLAMDDPQAVRGAVLVAPSIDPNTEQPRWYNEAMTWWVVRELVPDEFAWSNRELMPLAPELRNMEPRWRSLDMPVTVIQGAKDALVDPRTADYAQQVLPPGDAVIRVPDEGHFILWEKPEIVVRAILSQLEHPVTAGAPTQ